MTEAQAGIYVQGSGGYGTKMYFATTSSHAAGPKTALTIDHLGDVTVGKITANTFIGALNGNASSATTFSTNRTNYKNVTDGAVVGQLM